MKTRSNASANPLAFSAQTPSTAIPEPGSLCVMLRVPADSTARLVSVIAVLATYVIVRVVVNRVAMELIK